MEEMEKNAKLGVLKKLKDAASARMKDGLKGMGGMKKVSVMSDSPEGLKAGLNKAEDMVEKKELVHPEHEMSKVDQILSELSDEECKELHEKLMERMSEKEMDEGESEESEEMEF